MSRTTPETAIGEGLLLGTIICVSHKDKPSPLRTVLGVLSTRSIEYFHSSIAPATKFTGLCASLAQQGVAFHGEPRVHTLVRALGIAERSLVLDGYETATNELNTIIAATAKAVIDYGMSDSTRIIVIGATDIHSRLREGDPALDGRLHRVVL